VLLAACALAACGAPALLSGQTQGELFRKFIATEKEHCAGRFPPSAEMVAATKASGIRLSDCDILLLDTPEDPQATEAGRQAHAIRLPAPHDKPREVYKPGMSSTEYFQALCAAEAGEFIFRTVDNVEGVFEMRPRTKAPNYAFNHLYYLEDPYGYMDAEVSYGPFQMISPT
jgi:hypothetical protein